MSARRSRGQTDRRAHHANRVGMRAAIRRFDCIRLVPAKEHDRMKSTLVAAGIAMFTTLTGLASAASSDIVLQDVPLRAGVTGDIHVRVLTNPRARCHANTILAVHGATGAASNWEPLAEAIFDAGPPGEPVCRFVAVD